MQFGGMFHSDYGMFPRGFPRQRLGPIRGRKQATAMVTTTGGIPNETA